MFLETEDTGLAEATLSHTQWAWDTLPKADFVCPNLNDNALADAEGGADPDVSSWAKKENRPVLGEVKADFLTILEEFVFVLSLRRCSSKDTSNLKIEENCNLSFASIRLSSRGFLYLLRLGDGRAAEFPEGVCFPFRELVK